MRFKGWLRKEDQDVKEKKIASDRRRAAGNSSRSYLWFSFSSFFVERNDRLKPGPSEHVHFVNCGGVNDPNIMCDVHAAIARQKYRTRSVAFYNWFLFSHGATWKLFGLLWCLSPTRKQRRNVTTLTRCYHHWNKPINLSREELYKMEGIYRARNSEIFKSNITFNFFVQT